MAPGLLLDDSANSETEMVVRHVDSKQRVGGTFDVQGGPSLVFVGLQTALLDSM